MISKTKALQEVSHSSNLSLFITCLAIAPLAGFIAGPTLNMGRIQAVFFAYVLALGICFATALFESLLWWQHRK